MMCFARCLAVAAACIVAALPVASATAAPPSVEVMPVRVDRSRRPG